MMLTATRFIAFLGADHDDRIIKPCWMAIDETLRSAGWFAADHTDRMQFGHVFGNAKQAGEGAERFSAKIEVKASDDDANITSCQSLDDINDHLIEELDFVDGNDGRGWVNDGK
jgi:hypothetical protein